MGKLSIALEAARKRRKNLDRESGATDAAPRPARPAGNTHGDATATRQSGAEAVAVPDPGAAVGTSLPDDAEDIVAIGEPLPAEPQRHLSMNDVRELPLNTTAFETNRILLHDNLHPAETPYRMLRTRLMRRMRSHGWRILGISSMGPNEGKSYTSINLAISIAAEIDQEAVLLDLDLRRPTLYGYLGIKPADFTDLNAYFHGNATLDDLLFSPGIERLGCILSAEPQRHPSDLLASTPGQRLFEELRSRLSPNAVVIVDLPPMLYADDALAIAPVIDGLMLVVEERRTKREDLAEARDLLEDFNLVGTVLNKSTDKERRKNYYYY